MQRTRIEDLSSKIGETISISGWVHTIRDQGKVKFLQIRDITGIVQCVYFDSSESIVQIFKQLALESVVEIVGVVKEEKQAPTGIEIQLTEIEILTTPLESLPIQVVEKSGDEASLDKRLDYRWIDLRKPEKQLIFKVWTLMEHAFREFCIKEGFIEIHSPKITVTATESGSELFEIKYFDTKAYLAQSPQLYKQMAMCAGLEKVFEVGPVYRANPSFTSRHDTEFTMYDIEMSFIKSHHELMEFEERLIQYMLQAIYEKYGSEIKKYYGRELVVPTLPFPRMTISEVKEITKELGIKDEREGDLSPEEERTISDYVKEKFGHEFVFVHEFPAKVRAFYSMKLEEKPELTKSFDLLWNGLEITSGAQREHRVEKLKEQIRAKGFDTAKFESYLQFFSFGCPPHGGFAPGPTRMLMKIFDIQNVREVTYLYRGVKRLTP